MNVHEASQEVEDVAKEREIGIKNDNKSASYIVEEWSKRSAYFFSEGKLPVLSITLKKYSRYYRPIGW